MCAPKAPKAPDPIQTAAAQTGQNVSTAIANNTMQMVDQYTPDGSLTNKVIGYETVKGPDGKDISVPRYSQTTALSADQQKIYDLGNQSKINLSGLAADQSGFLKDYMAQPFDGSNEATEARLMDLSRKRVDPVMAQNEEALRTRLANQGLQPGSAAWDREMTQFGQQRNDAYNSMALQGRGQAMSEALTARNQPINEIIGLMSGSQVNQPNVQGVTPQSMPNVDVAGLINNGYNQKLQAWQQQVANRGSMLGGLFGLGASAISGGLF